MALQTAKPASARPLNRLQNVALGKIDSAVSKPHDRRTQAPRRELIGDGRRIARCPACGHAGSIPRDLPTTARLRCSACGTAALARQAVGDRPARFHHRSATRRAKESAAADVLARYGDPELNDSIDDLFRDAGAAAT